VAHIKTFHLIKINGNTGTQQQKKNDVSSSKVAKWAGGGRAGGTVGGGGWRWVVVGFSVVFVNYTAAAAGC